LTHRAAAGFRKLHGIIALRGINSFDGVLVLSSREIETSIDLPFSTRELTMVASSTAASDPGADRACEAPAELLDKPSRGNCGPMIQQGTMGAHGHEMHPQGFLRLIGCHDSNRQKQDAVARLHA
jgi:hypothetical protein